MDDMVRFTIKLSASSNISYRRRFEVEYDRETWDDMSIESRRKAIDEAIEQAVWEDIEGVAEFENDDDNPDA